MYIASQVPGGDSLKFFSQENVEHFLLMSKGDELYYRFGLIANALTPQNTLLLPNVLLLMPLPMMSQLYPYSTTKKKQLHCGQTLRNKHEVCC